MLLIASDPDNGTYRVANTIQSCAMAPLSFCYGSTDRAESQSSKNLCSLLYLRSGPMKNCFTRYSLLDYSDIMHE